MKIGLYFGSFNPIHIGHCIIANHVLSNSELEQIWFVVTPQNPFKKASSLLNEYHRLFLVQTALADEADLKGSDIEFHLPRPSYTVNTLTHLSEKYPQHAFSILMGSDSFTNLPNWKNADVITKNYSIYIYNRPGFPVNNASAPNIFVLNAPLLEISSTLIRDNISRKKSIRFLVPDRVKEEIEKNGYYK